MSELINTRNMQADFRWQLLSGVSVLALCGTIGASDPALADAADHPAVWIELGGQLERVQNTQDAFTPPFSIKNMDAPFNVVPPSVLQRLPRQAFGGEGKISFEPQGSGWSFSAAVRYGRSNNARHTHQQTTENVSRYITGIDYTVPVAHFNDTDASHHESHTILDFMAGRDVGLGLSSRGGKSTIGFGMRYVQFHTKSTAVLRSTPDFYYAPNAKYNDRNHHHSYYARSDLSRNFSGIGPSLSVAGSSRLLGSGEAGELVFDWGANASVLFGRQKVVGTHKTGGNYFHGLGPSHLGARPFSTYHQSTNIARTHSVVVPNVGGFAGLSVRRESAKVSFGYRADFFLGAMDRGIDIRKTQSVGFYGPFATISIGLGG